jgi:thiosulfate/3-mercaptopyruvate sulfurtransferase
MKALAGCPTHLTELADVLIKVMKHPDVVNGTQVIVYDRSGIFSAPRVWWTFRVFGHKRCMRPPLTFHSLCKRHAHTCTAYHRGRQKVWPCRVAVLDGGFPAWQAKGYPTDTEPVGDADIEAAVHAARQSSGSPHRYQAQLQVCFVKHLIWSS